MSYRNSWFQDNQRWKDCPKMKNFSGCFFFFFLVFQYSTLRYWRLWCVSFLTICFKNWQKCLLIWKTGRCQISFMFCISWRHIDVILTLGNNLSWIYFGPTRCIHPWTILVHATLRVSYVIDTCNIWLADVTFDWRHIIVTAVERNNQTRPIIAFLRRLFARFKTKFHK